MLFDLMYELGGDAAVQLADAFFGPLFDFFCSMSAQFGGAWDIAATALERLLS